MANTFKIFFEKSFKPGDKVENVNPDCKQYKSKGTVTSVKDIIVPAQPRYPSLRQLELQEKQKGLRRKNKELSKKEQKELDTLQKKYLSPTKLQTMYPDRYAFDIVNINGKDYPQDYLKAKEYVVEVKTDPEEISKLPPSLPVFNLGGIVGLRRVIVTGYIVCKIGRAHV